MDLLGALWSLIEFIWGVVEGVIIFLDLAALAADVLAFFKSTDNRHERREAKRSGTPPPPRTGWTWVWQLLTPLVILITLWIVIKRW